MLRGPLACAFKPQCSRRAACTFTLAWDPWRSAHRPHGRCDAPCALHTTEEDYRKLIDEAVRRDPQALAAEPRAKVHTYGKAPRPGRKVGHVNVAGHDLDDLVYDARAAAAHFLD